MTLTSSTPLRRRTLLGASAAVGLPPWALAQSSLPRQPDVQYRLVVGTSAGDSMDYAARLLARYLGTTTGRSWIVENKPGANGLIAAEYVARTRTPGVVNVYVGMASQMLVNQLLYDKPPVNVRSELARLYMVSIGSHYLSVNVEKTPVKTLMELVTHMKANKGKLSHGSSGLGSYTHLLGVRLNQITGADMVLVPYKGEAPTVLAMLSGELDMGWISAASIKQHPGKLIPLAGNGNERMLSVYPDVPTFAEAGIADSAFGLQGWIGTAVSASMPEDNKQALGQALHSVANHPGFLEQCTKLGIPVVRDSSPTSFEAFYQSTYAQWEKLVRDVGVKLD